MVRDNKKPTQAADENGSYHMVECTGDGCDGCIIWSKIWFPERIPKIFLARPFLCGFYDHDTISKSSQAGAPVLEEQTIFGADAIQQYGSRENVRIVGLDDGSSNEYPYQEVIKMAGYCRVSLKRDVISVCHWFISKTTVSDL